MNSENTHKTRGYYWLLWVTAMVIWLFDRLTKAQIIARLDIGETWRPWAGTPILELFALTHTKNSGAAFGIFPSGGWFFTAVAIVVTVTIIWYAPQIPRQQWWLFLSLGLEMGGALGNLTDRLTIGWVTDFVHIGSFAIFNVADSAIVSGVIILFVHFWWEERQLKAKEEKEDAWPALELEEWEEEEEEMYPKNLPPILLPAASDEISKPHRAGEL